MALPTRKGIPGLILRGYRKLTYQSISRCIKRVYYQRIYLLFARYREAWRFKPRKGMVVIRNRIADISQKQTRPPRVIDFLHPAYPDGANVLLTLYAVDDGGIDYDFAHTACSIIAGNAFADGWLARRTRGHRGGPGTYEPVPRALLKHESYYFCVGKNTSTVDRRDAYPIVTRFDDWEFPHHIWAPTNAPDPYTCDAKPISTWTRYQTTAQGREEPSGFSNPRMVIRALSQTCRVTNYAEANEVAHLVPSANASWFDRNRMTKYCTNSIPTGGRSGIHDHMNGMLLRRDLHLLLDLSRFVFVPKCGFEGEPVLVTHVLQPGLAAELLHLYHNRALQSPLPIAMPLLFARFALNIFHSAAPFISAGDRQECKVRVFDPAASAYRVTTMTRGQVTVYRTQTSSMSPRKRIQVAGGEELNARDGDGCSSDSRGSDTGETWSATEISGTDSDDANKSKSGQSKKEATEISETKSKDAGKSKSGRPKKQKKK
ncbi:hypothetical protein F4824DRAFT_357218 [Ustulina deusta]|nr:hypothetical protein F4824DRAFT_357218 [Ustulina deusta]